MEVSSHYIKKHIINYDFKIISNKTGINQINKKYKEEQTWKKLSK